ncbi:MAG: cytochrome-c peroxidase [Cytophagales bacterium]|nr:MAG: cytochrome-c peroxidase [Cytophagales bacterium]
MLKFSIILTFILFSCKHSTQENIIPNIESTDIISVPSYFGVLPQPTYNIATKEGIELGKKLFFDPILSSNNQVSCGTCHLPEFAFAEPNTIFSTKGVSKKELHRHTPALLNLAWHNGFFWDGGATSLEAQAFGPITHADEMNQNLRELVLELKKNNQYVDLFKKAFPSDTISSQKIAFALSQFQRSIISAKSKYDSYLKLKDSTVFSLLEWKGYKLFLLKCESCHKEPFLTDFSYNNNGLDSTFTDITHEELFKGRYRITLDLKDLGKYKTPSLRNIMLTAPYMHDGRLSNIDDVLEHYSQKIKKSPTLDVFLTNKISLSMEEKNNLKAFLNTLTDL